MKKVLITGANKSIGFETARQLALLNYHIFLGCRDLNRGKDAMQRLKKEGFLHVDLIQIDISNVQSVRKARMDLDAMTDTLDVLINNAGIPGLMPQSASSTPLETIRTVFDTNFFGTICVTQTFLDLLMKSDSPRIVNVT